MFVYFIMTSSEPICTSLAKFRAKIKDQALFQSFINLSSNKISSIGQYAFPPGLNYLSLSYNRLEYIDFTKQSFTHLNKLYLDNNLITYVSKRFSRVFLLKKRRRPHGFERGT